MLWSQAHPALTPATYAATRDFLTHWCLDLVPDLRNLLHSIRNPRQPSRVELRLWASLQERLRPYEDYFRRYPFVVAPPQILSGGTITLGQQQADERPLTIPASILARHLLVAGPSGAGKTTLLAHLINDATQHGPTPLVIDPKDDYLAWAARNERVLLLHPGARVPFIARPEHLSLSEHVNLLVRVATSSFYSAEAGKAVLHEALHRAFAAQHPTIPDARRAIESLSKNSDTYARRDAIRGQSLRFQRFIDRYPGLSTTRNGPLIEQLLTHPVHIRLLQISETEDFLVRYVLERAHLAGRVRSERTLRTLVVLDEALPFIRTNPATIDHTSTLEGLAAQVREFGISLALSVTALGLVSPAVRANTGLLVVFPPTSHAELLEATRTLGLSPAQQDYLRGMRIGECIVRVQGWPHPLLVRIPPPTGSKIVSADELARAHERINHLTPTITSDTPTIASNDHPTPTVRSATPPSLPMERATIAPNAVALNPTTEALLRYSVQHPYTPASIAYHATNLHPVTGTKQRDLLVTLGLVQSERIVIHGGRGGTAVVLLPTTKGYERAGTKPPHRTRGGDSVQHQYLVWRLAQLISEAKIEVTVGTKSIDLLIAYNAQQHAAFVQHLTARGHALAALPIAFNDGDLIAVEVEVSQPGKTGAANAVKNADAGIVRTVIAVFPKLVDATIKGLRQSLDPEYHDRVIVIDILVLINRPDTRERQ